MLSEEQKQFRLLGIGASDAGVIMGVSPWKSRIGLWLEKMGLDIKIEETSRMRNGSLLEPFVIERFAMLEQAKILKMGEQLVHKTYDYVRCTLDARATLPSGEEVVVEAKTSNHFMEDLPPVYYWQVIHQLCITGLKKAYIPVLMPGDVSLEVVAECDDKPVQKYMVGLLRYKCFQVEANQQDQDRLLQECSKFWELVRNAQAPDAEQDGDSELLHPSSSKDDMDVGENMELKLAIVNLKVAKAAEEEAAKKVTAIMERVKSIIGAHSSASFNGRQLITWKSSSPSVRFDANSFKKEHKELYEKYLKTSPGGRRFLLK